MLRSLFLSLLVAGCVADPTPIRSSSRSTGGSGQPASGGSNDQDPQGDNAATPVDSSALDAVVAQVLAEGRVPGASIAIAKNGRVAFSKAYGNARVEDGVAFDVDTTVNVASVSKAIAATALMILVREGKLSLDDDAGRYVGVPLRNPKFPSTPITVGMLLTHTSSIDSRTDAVGRMVNEQWLDDGDSAYALADLARDTFASGGRYYAADNYSVNAPGTRYDYCNVCFALVGLVVENVAKQPFDRFSTDRLLAPLGMNATTWRLRDTNRDKLASGYDYDAATKKLTRVPHPGAPYYPAMTLRTTASDMTRLLVELAAPSRVLDKPSADRMLSPLFPSVAKGQGLAWFEESPGVYGHDGSYAGHASNVSLRPSDGVGVAVLLNGGADDRGEPLMTLDRAAWKLADSM